MKCSNFYEIVKRVKIHEQKELKAALEAHGGRFYFKDSFENHTQKPIIAVNMDNCEPEPQDVYVDCAMIDEYDGIVLKCTGKLDGEDYEVDPDDVFAGHLDYIISEIPETETVKDVSMPFVLS